MISIKKLNTLPKKTRLRKLITVLQDMEYGMQARDIDIPYLLGLIELLETEHDLPEWLVKKCERGKRELSSSNPTPENGLRRLCNDMRTGLQQYFHIEPADWDFIDTTTGTPERKKRNILPFTVILEDLRSPFNVGSIFRTAESFGVAKVILSPPVPTPEHKRVQRTAMGCTDIVAWEQREIDYTRDMQNGFVLETGGTPINSFAFPGAGTVLIGSEELGISPEAAHAADRGCGRVTIPTSGVKGSLNVSVAFGILMHRWYQSVRETEVSS